MTRNPRASLEFPEEPTLEPAGAPSRHALTHTPGDGRPNGGSEPVAAAELDVDKVAVFAKRSAQRGASAT
jgi:hypothetical protein